MKAQGFFNLITNIKDDRFEESRCPRFTRITSPKVAPLTSITIAVLIAKAPEDSNLLIEINCPKIRSPVNSKVNNKEIILLAKIILKINIITLVIPRIGSQGSRGSENQIRSSHNIIIKIF